MAKATRFAVLAGLTLAAAASQTARAAQHIYSFDSVTPITQKMTENGLTFIVEKSVMTTRVKRLLETLDVGAADLRPAPESVLGAGGLNALIGRDAPERTLYAITDKEDGVALGHALCRGSTHVWLAFGRVKAGQDLRVHALGDDPLTGKARLCVTLDYAFHGEWALPQSDLPQPDRTDRFNTAPQNRRY
jgi:hypothetical protein